MDKLPEKEIESPEPGDGRRDPQVNEETEASATPQPSAAAEPTAASTPEPAPRRPTFDEALGEMRQSLREEETKEKAGFGSGVKRFVQRLFRRKTAPLPEVAEARLDEFAIPEATQATETVAPEQTSPEIAAAPEAPAEAPEAASEPERPPTESSTFQKLVRNKMTGALPGLDSMEPLVAPQEPATEEQTLEFQPPEPTDLKEQPQSPAQGKSTLQAVRGEEESRSQDVSSMRQAALEDYVSAPAEEEATEAAPLPRRLRRGWRDMRPIDRTLLTGALGLLAMVVVGLSAFTAYTYFKPTPTAPPATPTASVAPIPLSITLPGLPAFLLRTGQVQNGKWDPSGAEWLQGTEICRWVALPHTVQLEAVLRTLKSDDPIQLTMSDYSNITYKVKSIKQIAPDQIASLAPSTPSLLVILSKQDSPTRWVVVAEP